MAKLLMCPPDFYRIEYEINPWMHRDKSTDSVEAHRQWWSLHEALVKLGANVELITPVSGLPDMVFTANAGLIWRDFFVTSRFHYPVRAPESEHFEQWFAAHGFHIIHLPRGLTFEGTGDALFCGSTLFGGTPFRSEGRSHRWLAAQLGFDVVPLTLADPRFYHLDTCFCPLAEGEAIYYPGAFDEASRLALADRIERLIPVSEEEAVSFCCNAVVVDKIVILNTSAPRVSKVIERSGYQVELLRLDEFIKAGGCAKCLTLRLDGEEAATWKRTDVASSEESNYQVPLESALPTVGVTSLTGIAASSCTPRRSPGECTG